MPFPHHPCNNMKSTVPNQCSERDETNRKKNLANSFNLSVDASAVFI